MSHTTTKSITRRSFVAGSAGVLTATGLAAAGLTFGTAGSAAASVGSSAPSGVADGAGLASHALCKAHHKELSEHLGAVLNSAYVDERMKNRMLTTSHCPHCQVAIAPDMKTHAAFAALA